MSVVGPATGISRFVLLALVYLGSAGCQSTLEFVGIRLFYRQAPPPADLLRDIPYQEGGEHARHRLDLFIPAGGDWPTLVFVHGGGWTGGGKELVVSGADVYGNVGRYYADRGFGVAVINYRLQFQVTWREQVEDVGAAVEWLHTHLDRFGGDGNAIFLSGHSAGAQLVARLAVDEGLTTPWTRAVCGVIAVSGAGYDLADERTYELGAERSYYEDRFRAGDPTDGWLMDASTVPWVDADDPPLLLLYSTREWPALGYQNELLGHAVTASDGDAEVVPIKGQNHGRMVLAMSRDTAVSESVLDFLRTSECPRKID